MHPIKTLFIAQFFDNRTVFEDSSALNEIINPLIQSGLVGDYKIHAWNFGKEYIENQLNIRFDLLREKIRSKKVTIYAAGKHTEGLWAQFSKFNVSAICDKQPEKIGKTFNGISVIDINEINTDIIIVSSRAWELDIIAMLQVKFPNKEIYGLYDDVQRAILIRNQEKTDLICSELASDQYDLIVYIPAEPAEALNLEQLASLKDSAITTPLAAVWWDYDDSSSENIYMTLEKNTLQTADLIIDPGHFTKTRAMKDSLYPYNKHNMAYKVAVLPTPVDIELYFPREKTINVAIFGSDAGLRRQWIDMLQKNYPKDFQHIGGVGLGKVAIPMEEYARLAGKTKIMVNTQTYSFRTQCKGKVREALASGCLLIEEDNTESRQFFGNQPFVKYFTTKTELLDTISYYLSNPIEREELAHQGYQWYLEHWAPKQWAKKVLSAVHKSTRQVDI